VGGPRDYFDHLERELDTSALPVVDRDISDWWIDGPASMPTAMGRFRRAMKALPNLPAPAAVEDNLILFAEHTFGLNAQLVKVRAAEQGWKIAEGFDDYVASWEDKEAYAKAAWDEVQPQCVEPVPAPDKVPHLAKAKTRTLWDIQSDERGITRLTDPNGHVWIDASVTPDWPRFGTVAQFFVPRETGSWLHHDLPFAPNEGAYSAVVESVTPIQSDCDYGIEVAQSLSSPAGSICRILFRLTGEPGSDLLRARLSLIGKEPTAQSEALVLSLPLRSVSPIYAGEVGGRLLRVDEDQLSASNRDEHAFGDGWIVQDGTHRLAVSSPDAYLWHFGGFRYCEFNKHPRSRTGEVYAHLLNNAWQTNFRVWTGGDLSFDFLLRPLSSDEAPQEVLTALSSLWLPGNDS
jgi:hypothetical protein